MNDFTIKTQLTFIARFHSKMYNKFEINTSEMYLRKMDWGRLKNVLLSKVHLKKKNKKGF